MTLRWWYLRRGIPWLALLGCCAAALVLTGVLARWPEAAVGLLPALLACCAVAAAFLFDERATAVVAVTPRGATWRRTARLAVAAVPLAVWALVVAARPGDLPLERPGWWLVGAATIGLVTGIAALASRRDVAAPGSVLAGVIPVAVIGPVVVTAFLGWDTIYPIEGFGEGIRQFWLVVGVGGAIACVLALRPGVRS